MYEPIDPNAQTRKFKRTNLSGIPVGVRGVCHRDGWVTLYVRLGVFGLFLASVLTLPEGGRCLCRRVGG